MRLCDYEYEWRPSLKAPNSDEETILLINLYGCIMPILSIWELELKIKDTRYRYKVNFCTWSPVFEWGCYQFEEEGHNLELIYNAWTLPFFSNFDLFIDGKEYHSGVAKGEYYTQYFARILTFTSIITGSCGVIAIVSAALAWNTGVIIVFSIIAGISLYFTLKALVGYMTFRRKRDGSSLIDNEEIPI
ncbi:uncharacterized protein TRIADDRAFT_60165 [Trichoplax adhaerens]|uniref:Uncharacterized protein n=1 Tax=Trichoplax adhaerens TaxID=10228 RepID=B3S7H3_TRIAD|nr:predicted protein [Trichoplax adhaerens]EDV21289.1 predicted protein [Trichoplax adhaerens]|eukprot:XP_002116256.1 predicted protein [Trichoplax adhaerens]